MYGFVGTSDYLPSADKWLLYIYCIILANTLQERYSFRKQTVYRRMAENGFAPPPLGNFADISYLVENCKPSLLRDVCTLCSGALVCKSL